MWVLLPRVNDKNGDLSFKNLDTNVSLCNYLMQFLTKAFFFFFPLILSPFPFLILRSVLSYMQSLVFSDRPS